jgi:site-specific DNA-methyltransferase (adenine-specific)
MKYQILEGDNRETLKTLADNSIDAIVTDPPYGIDFLGKSWDANTGALETYQECLRVLKPGGHILAFSAARTYHHLAVTLEQAGFEIRDQIMWIYSSGFPKAQAVKGFPGWKNGGLKPAHEPIALARKPTKTSIKANMETWRVGALNIDATRVPYANDKDKASIDHKVPTAAWSGHTIQVDSYEKGEFVKVETNELGRFPSNVIGEIAEPYQKYFYCPKVNRSERHIEDSVENNHPTVKPIELMKYLIKLVTPPGGVVLDPFNGSGSTGCAAVALGHEYIGCELDPAYVEISKRRIEQYNKSENNFDALFE